MSKSKKIFITIFIALLGIVFEVLNYYVFVLNDMVGKYIVSISIFGNLMFYCYLDTKEGAYKMIEQIFNVNKKKFYELYRDTSSWEEFDAYLRSLPNFKVLEFITKEESKLLYLLAKNE